MKSHNFENLDVWKRGCRLAVNVCVASHASKEFALKDQIVRSSISIPSNIAEGQGRNTKGEFLQFLGIAKGSLCELETQILIAKNLGYIATTDALEERINEVARLLNGLVNSLKTDN